MKNKIFKSLFLVLLVVVLSVPTFADTDKSDVEEDVKEVTEFEEMENLVDYILENYQSSVLDHEITKEELIDGAYKGIFEKLDKHSNFYTEEEYKHFEKSANGEYSGIGAVITKGEEAIEIVTPLDNSPAKKAGLMPKDQIIEVNGENIQKMSIEEAVTLITGEEGTKVKLKIKRNGKFLDKEITRAIIEMDPVEVEVKDNSIGYIRIKRFQRNVDDDILEALEELKSKNVTKLIIDLRNNPGGYLSEALKVSDIFIDSEKAIMHIDYKKGDDISHFTKKEDYFKGPIAVLVNSGSASASEILASAIKQNEEGIVIGEKTYGKGTVQKIKRKNEERMKFTIAEYLTANKSKINDVGLEPNILVKEGLSSGDIDKYEHLAPMTENRDIYYEQSSVNVYGLQQRFNLLGYNLDEDGIFGPSTLKAVKKFQINNGLKVQGKLTLNLKNKLNTIIENKMKNKEDLILNKAIEYLEKR